MNKWPSVKPPFVNDGGYIALPIHDLKLPTQIDVEGQTYYAKDEYHCSLVSVKAIMPILIEKGISEQNAALQITQIFERQREVAEPQLVKYIGEFRIAEKEGRKTIVVMTEVSNLEGIFEALQDELNVAISVPPTHVTLMCTELNRGIGINTPEQLAATKVIRPADISNLRLAFDF